jgi:hypothetical protein
MAPSAATLLRAWESGAAVAPLDRAPSLLQALGAVATSADAAELTVGQCDARLFELRRAIFGETLEVVATCSACQTDLELILALGDLQPPVREGPAAPLTVHAGGYTLRCRVPGHEDLRALARRGGEVTSRDLLERCLLEASSPAGLPADPDELPEATAEAAVEALAEADPGAQTALRVSCLCGSEWVAELDICDVVWNDLTEWVGRTLTEVHQLARAYGWSEAEILAMSGWRRRWYLEAAGW